MKVKIENSVLTVDLQELVDSLSKEEQRHFARHLVADKELFAAVLECVADESGLGHYFEDEESWWFGSDNVLELRQKLLPLMPAIARGAVQAALQQRDAAKAEAERYRSWAFKLYHAWPDDRWHTRPRGPEDWKPTFKPSDAVVDAFMAAPPGGAGDGS